jgi:alkylhydroperoxidase family enzyme
MLPADRRTPEGAGPALSTLARHPDLAKAFLTFSYLTYRSTLPPRIRETAILRVAHRTGCAYEWVHHVGFGKEAGLTDEDIAAIRRGQPKEWLDGAVVRAVDEIDEAATVSDDTWTSWASPSTRNSGWT